MSTFYEERRSTFNEEHRFGSAAWETSETLRRKGLFKGKAVFLGFDRSRAIRLAGDAPLITLAGAGSGKLRDQIAYNICGWRDTDGQWIAPPRLFVNDARGELAAISIQNHMRLRKAAYCLNAFGLHGLPQHGCNPLDRLRRGAKRLHADAKWAAADLVALSGSPNGKYFEMRAREWIEMLLLFHVERHDGITLPQLYDLINAIQDPGAWEDIGTAMLDCGIPEVRRTAIEIHTKRKEGEKEYGAIMGEILMCLNFMSDPAVRAMLSRTDFSLDVLCQRDCTVFNIVPAEYASNLAPLNRLLVGMAMLGKFSHPEAPQVLFMIDEAATLGNFEALLRGYTYGRGMGVRVWSFWQDVGQITRNFGPGALSSFLGSSQVRQFFGVRDFDTAKLISAMLGTETLHWDPVLRQAGARRDLLVSAQAMLSGGDPLLVGLQCRQQALTAMARDQQARQLLTPDEVLTLREDGQILFVSGLGLNPIYAQKYPYYTRPEMAGAYMPNPYHPPADRVVLPGGRWANVMTARVPAKYAHWPQYQSGTWSYVAGYRPL